MTSDKPSPEPAAQDRAGQGTRLLLLLAWPTILATAVALSPWATRHWALDLTTHMRAHLMVAAAVLCPLLFWTHRRRLAMLCLLAAVGNSWSVRPWTFVAPPDSATPDSSAVLRILFWNVYVGNDDAAAVLRLAAEHDADVVVLLEFNGALGSSLEPLRESHPYYREIAGTGDAFGLALYSRIAGSITPGRLSYSVPYLTLRTSAGAHPAIQITGAHLYPPVGDAMWRGRDTQLADLAQHLASDTTLPRIVGGDFNITPWAAPYIRFLQTTRLVDTRPGFGYMATWPRFLGPIGIPIDQVAADPSIRVLQRRAVFASRESDHAAVLLTVAASPMAERSATLSDRRLSGD